jgi:hypothetical protein
MKMVKNSSFQLTGHLPGFKACGFSKSSTFANRRLYPKHRGIHSVAPLVMAFAYGAVNEIIGSTTTRYTPDDKGQNPPLFPPKTTMFHPGWYPFPPNRGLRLQPQTASVAKFLQKTRLST